MKQKSIIQEMKDDVQNKKKLAYRMNYLFFAYVRGEDKRWAKGSSALFRSLIEYYGQIEGKRKWVGIIREKRMRVLRFKKHVLHARKQYLDAKATLSLAVEHLDS